MHRIYKQLKAKLKNKHIAYSRAGLVALAIGVVAGLSMPIGTNAAVTTGKGLNPLVKGDFNPSPYDPKSLLGTNPLSVRGYYMTKKEHKGSKKRWYSGDTLTAAGFHAPILTKEKPGSRNGDGTHHPQFISKRQNPGYIQHSGHKLILLANSAPINHWDIGGSMWLADHSRRQYTRSYFGYDRFHHPYARHHHFSFARDMPYPHLGILHNPIGKTWSHGHWDPHTAVWLPYGRQLYQDERYGYQHYEARHSSHHRHYWIHHHAKWQRLNVSGPIGADLKHFAMNHGTNKELAAPQIKSVTGKKHPSSWKRTRPNSGNMMYVGLPWHQPNSNAKVIAYFPHSAYLRTTPANPKQMTTRKSHGVYLNTKVTYSHFKYGDKRYWRTWGQDHATHLYLVYRYEPEYWYDIANKRETFDNGHHSKYMSSYPFYGDNNVDALDIRNRKSYNASLRHRRRRHEGPDPKVYFVNRHTQMYRHVRANGTMSRGVYVGVDSSWRPPKIRKAKAKPGFPAKDLPKSIRKSHEAELTYADIANGRHSVHVNGKLIHINSKDDFETSVGVNPYGSNAMDDYDNDKHDEHVTFYSGPVYRIGLGTMLHVGTGKGVKNAFEFHVHHAARIKGISNQDGRNYDYVIEDPNKVADKIKLHVANNKTVSHKNIDALIRDYNEHRPADALGQHHYVTYDELYRHDFHKRNGHNIRAWYPLNKGHDKYVFYYNTSEERNVVHPAHEQLGHAVIHVPVNAKLFYNNIWTGKRIDEALHPFNLEISPVMEYGSAQNGLLSYHVKYEYYYSRNANPKTDTADKSFHKGQKVNFSDLQQMGVGSASQTIMNLQGDKKLYTKQSDPYNSLQNPVTNQRMVFEYNQPYIRKARTGHYKGNALNNNPVIKKYFNYAKQYDGTLFPIWHIASFNKKRADAADMNFKPNAADDDPGWNSNAGDGVEFYPDSNASGADPNAYYMSKRRPDYNQNFVDPPVNQEPFHFASSIRPRESASIGFNVRSGSYHLSKPINMADQGAVFYPWVHGPYVHVNHQNHFSKEFKSAMNNSLTYHLNGDGGDYAYYTPRLYSRFHPYTFAFKHKGPNKPVPTPGTNGPKRVNKGSAHKENDSLKYTIGSKDPNSKDALKLPTRDLDTSGTDTFYKGYTKTLQDGQKYTGHTLTATSPFQKNLGDGFTWTDPVPQALKITKVDVYVGAGKGSDSASATNGSFGPNDGWWNTPGHNTGVTNLGPGAYISRGHNAYGQKMVWHVANLGDGTTIHYGKGSEMVATKPAGSDEGHNPSDPYQNDGHSSDTINYLKKDYGSNFVTPFNPLNPSMSVNSNDNSGSNTKSNLKGNKNKNNSNDSKSDFDKHIVDYDAMGHPTNNNLTLYFNSQFLQQHSGAPVQIVLHTRIANLPKPKPMDQTIPGESLDNNQKQKDNNNDATKHGGPQENKTGWKKDAQEEDAFDHNKVNEPLTDGIYNLANRAFDWDTYNGSYHDATPDKPNRTNVPNTRIKRYRYTVYNYDWKCAEDRYFNNWKIFHSVFDNDPAKMKMDPKMQETKSGLLKKDKANDTPAKDCNGNYREGNLQWKRDFNGRTCNIIRPYYIYGYENDVKKIPVLVPGSNNTTYKQEDHTYRVPDKKQSNDTTPKSPGNNSWKYRFAYAPYNTTIKYVKVRLDNRKWQCKKGKNPSNDRRNSSKKNFPNVPPVHEGPDNTPTYTPGINKPAGITTGSFYLPYYVPSAGIDNGPYPVPGSPKTPPTPTPGTPGNPHSPGEPGTPGSPVPYLPNPFNPAEVSHSKLVINTDKPQNGLPFDYDTRTFSYLYDNFKKDYGGETAKLSFQTYGKQFGKQRVPVKSRDVVTDQSNDFVQVGHGQNTDDDLLNRGTASGKVTPFGSSTTDGIFLNGKNIRNQGGNLTNNDSTISVPLINLLRPRTQGVPYGFKWNNFSGVLDIRGLKVRHAGNGLIPGKVSNSKNAGAQIPIRVRLQVTNHNKIEDPYRTQLNSRGYEANNPVITDASFGATHGQSGFPHYDTVDKMSGPDRYPIPIKGQGNTDYNNERAEAKANDDPKDNKDIAPGQPEQTIEYASTKQNHSNDPLPIMPTRILYERMALNQPRNASAKTGYGMRNDLHMQYMGWLQMRRYATAGSHLDYGFPKAFAKRNTFINYQKLRPMLKNIDLTRPLGSVNDSNHSGYLSWQRVNRNANIPDYPGNSRSFYTYQNRARLYNLFTKYYHEQLADRLYQSHHKGYGMKIAKDNTNAQRRRLYKVRRIDRYIERGMDTGTSGLARFYPPINEPVENTQKTKFIYPPRFPKGSNNAQAFRHDPWNHDSNKWSYNASIASDNGRATNFTSLPIRNMLDTDAITQQKNPYNGDVTDSPVTIPVPGTFKTHYQFFKRKLLENDYHYGDSGAAILDDNPHYAQDKFANINNVGEGIDTKAKPGFDQLATTNGNSGESSDIKSLFSRDANGIEKGLWSIYGMDYHGNHLDNAHQKETTVGVPRMFTPYWMPLNQNKKHNGPTDDRNYFTSTFSAGNNRFAGNWFRVALTRPVLFYGNQFLNKGASPRGNLQSSNDELVMQPFYVTNYRSFNNKQGFHNYERAWLEDGLLMDHGIHKYNFGHYAKIPDNANWTLGPMPDM